MQRNTKFNLFSAIENGVDMIINLIAMTVSYMFAVIFIDPTVTFNPTTVVLIFLSILLSSMTYQAFDMYGRVPFARTYYHMSKIIKANLVFFGIIVIIALIFGADHGRPFILLWIGLSFIISSALLIFKKQIILYLTKTFNKSRFSLRKVIIVGDNTATSAEFVKEATANLEYAMILGYVGDKIDDSVGCDKLGSFADLERVLDEYKPDDVIFAVDAYDKRHIIRLVNMCDDRCIKVYFLPVIFGYFKNQRQIEQVGSIPMINIHATPLDNFFNAFIKRAIDIVGSLFLIILTSPIMIAAAIAVRISSPGPILFKQERVGKMGKTFTMLKFRSMHVNVGSDKTWTRVTDPRKTKIGAFLRKTSIDELPQFFNVLFGSMSLVGPRPEVPHYVEYFKSRIPLYMIKHYVKPGITGLAQIKGLRGDTSIDDRIHCDIEYIENWSLGLDISILLQTPFKAFNKHERYAKSNDNEEDIMLAPTEDAAELLELEAKSNGKKKILYAASTMSHIENFHKEYIDKLRDDGYIVKVMARGDGADYNIPFEKKLLSSTNTACRRNISKILKKENFDAIILNTSLAAFHIRLACPRAIRPRIVNIVHGYLFSESVSPLKRLLLILCEKFLAGRTDSIIVMNSEDMRASLKHRFTSGKIYSTRGMGAVVRDPITPVEKIREEFRLGERYTLAFVGELSERKNQEFLIKAHLKLKEAIPGAALLLVGDGALREYYESLIDEYDLADSVILTGQREDACDIMRASDLYVSASSIEGMPFNIIEALGCRKPVLASRIKGHEDLIEDGKSGFFYRFGNEEEYVQKVISIHNGIMKINPEDIYQRYRRYDKENVFRETYSVIREAINDD